MTRFVTLENDYSKNVKCHLLYCCNNVVYARPVYGFYPMRACKFLLIISHKTLAIVVSLHWVAYDALYWVAVFDMAQQCAYVIFKMDGQLLCSVRVSLPYLTHGKELLFVVYWLTPDHLYICATAATIIRPGDAYIVIIATPHLYSVTCHLNVNIAAWACAHLSLAATIS